MPAVLQLPCVRARAVLYHSHTFLCMSIHASSTFHNLAPPCNPAGSLGAVTSKHHTTCSHNRTVLLADVLECPCVSLLMPLVLPLLLLAHVPPIIWAPPGRLPPWRSAASCALVGAGNLKVQHAVSASRAELVDSRGGMPPPCQPLWRPSHLRHSSEGLLCALHQALANKGNPRPNWQGSALDQTAAVGGTCTCTCTNHGHVTRIMVNPSMVELSYKHACEMPSSTPWLAPALPVVSAAARAVGDSSPPTPTPLPAPLTIAGWAPVGRAGTVGRWGDPSGTMADAKHAFLRPCPRGAAANLRVPGRASRPPPCPAPGCLQGEHEERL